MRHLTRLYFENTTDTEQFVSLVDQGVERENPLFNIKVGTISLPTTVEEVIAALKFLWATQCFFKLPIGAHAIVDIYIPDLVGSDAPKVFDYQVFKAKAPDAALGRDRSLADFFRRVDKIPPELFASGGTYTGDSPLGPNGPTATTGPVGGTCYYSSTGPTGPGNPCGAVGSTACDDTILKRASCVNENGVFKLICVPKNTVGPGET